MFDILRCNICGEKFEYKAGSLVCAGGHCFDIAREGYVNMLGGGCKAGELTGDNRQMAHNRRAFLEKGYYDILAQKIADMANQTGAKTVLDICCGEGYYTQYVSALCTAEVYGFDLSKDMVRLAAKRLTGARFFVSNISRIPVKNESVDFAYHLFAPFNSAEFYRIIKKGGLLVTAVPGKRHLYGLKEVLYKTPYENDEKVPDIGEFVIEDTIKLSKTITLGSSEDILSLLKMTPYYYHTPTAGINRLCALPKLETEIEFVLYVLKKQ